VPRIEVDVRTPIGEAPERAHNRWDPGIPPVLTVAPGEAVELDLRDGLDVQIVPGTSAAQLAGLDTSRGHPLTGPVAVEGAEPGDLLEVEVLEIQPDAWGYTVIVPGFGLLPERFPDPFVVEWELRDGVARSPQLPGIGLRGEPFLGVVGVAPSHERLQEFARREAEAAGMPPTAEGAVPPSAAAGLRTIPPRETGGNMDVREVRAGARLTLPVDVPGALFSAGDAHFAQGDGEVCGVALEMAARATLRFELRRDPPWRPRFPTVEYEDVPVPPRRWFATTGLPVTRDGRNVRLDTTLAARAALEDMLEWLVRVRGLTEQQAYVLAYVAVDLRISEIVDVPNVLVSAAIPLDVFDG
jgi:formamidase